MKIVTFVSCTFFAASAFGQCTPSWDTTLGTPGILGGNISNFVTWDDGTGEKLYVGGSFTNIGGNTLADRIASYDPTTGQWSNLGSGLMQGNTSVYVSEMVPWDDGTGEKLYVSGQFFSAGGLQTANSFAAWDGSSWSDLGAGFTQIDPRVINKILPLDIDGTGEKLFLGGNFEGIGDLTGNRGFAVFDGTSYSTVGNGTGLDPTDFSSVITDMILWDDGSGPKIYACGRFTSIDGWPAINVARFNITANQWEAFGQVLLPDQPFFSNSAFEIFDDGSGEALYLGGQQFRINGSGPVYCAAKWDGSNWTPVGQSVTGRITDLAVFDDGTGPALYASGDAFTEANYFGRLDNNTWVPVNGGVAAQPATQGNFAAVVGLFEWNNSLLLGGNFTQVGTQNESARGIAAYAACNVTCPADLAEPFGELNFFDVSAFLSAYTAMEPTADFNNDGVFNFFDVSAFLNAFSAGCP